MSEQQLSIPVIAVDGPGGVGKGTLCRWLATELGGWHLLDSGALYRLTAIAAHRRGIDLDAPSLDADAIAPIAWALDAHFGYPNSDSVCLDGEPVGDILYGESIGRWASLVATLAPVRAALLDRQRQFRQAPGLIADGRDMGTVVFPDAVLKIYLEASVEERAKRRYKQLNTKGIGASLSALAQNIAERDGRDAHRSQAPLVAASDAIVLDTSAMSIENVRQTVLALINENLL